MTLIKRKVMNVLMCNVFLNVVVVMVLQSMLMNAKTLINV